MSTFDLSPYHGIFPAGMTFFDAEGNLDTKATLDHWHWLVDQGVHGLVVKEGDKVKVKLLGFDDRGKVRLSMKVVDQETGEDISDRVAPKREREETAQ